MFCVSNDLDSMILWSDFSRFCLICLNCLIIILVLDLGGGGAGSNLRLGDSMVDSRLDVERNTVDLQLDGILNVCAL